MTMVEYIESVAARIRNGMGNPEWNALIAERLDDLAFQIRSTCATDAETFRERFAETLKQMQIDFQDLVYRKEWTPIEH